MNCGHCVRAVVVGMTMTGAACKDGEHAGRLASSTLTSPLLPGPDSEIATGIVINEFATRFGPNEECSEFIELRNDTAIERSLGGWRVSISDGRNSPAFHVSIPVGMVVGPGCHLLIGTVPSGLRTDVASSCNLTDAGGLALLSPGGIIVDQVGMSTASAFHEGTPLPPFSTTAIRQSYARDHSDTDHNAADFVFGPATPQNRFDDCTSR